MDLRQNKLKKEEWEALEVPVSPEELNILNLIRDGYTNLNIRYNKVPSLIEFMKISRDLNLFHGYLYDRLSRDGTEGVNDFVCGGGHLAIKSKGKIVGIVSFGLNKDHAMIHPKIKRQHMIYAKRACLMAIDYLESIGESIIAAKRVSIRYALEIVLIRCEVISLPSVSVPFRGFH